MRSLIFICLFVTTLAFGIKAHEFPYNPPKNFGLMQGMGNLHHPVTTKNPEAQRFFDQGLTFIYAFNHDAAYWSFLRASELDPNMAMAYWGMALAIGANINMEVDLAREKKAYELIQKALNLSNTVTDNERAYIQALSARYTDSSTPNLTTLGKDYNKAMADVHKKYPYDLDAATLYAESGLDLNPWHQWTSAGDPLPGTLEVVHVIENALKWDPHHLGANHYYIHAIEASKNPEKALMSAQRLRKMLPSSGHILHMPSHIYILVGDYHTAVESNLEAIKADQAYINAFGMDGIYPLHYMTHNMFFLSRAYQMEGRYEDAKKAAEDLLNFYMPHFERMPDLEHYSPAVMFVMLQFHRWNELINLKPFPEKMAVSNVLRHFGRAMAFTALGDNENAKKEKALFMEGKSKIPLSTMFSANKASTIFSIAEYQLNGKMAEIQMDYAGAVEWLRKAIAIQDQMNYNEPPDWYFPIRESLGGILLRSKRFPEAEVVFRGDLERHPRNGRSLFGLWKSLEAQHKFSDSFWIKRELDEAWQYSTTPLNIDSL